ncbi:unnamed protein product [Closterium sp. NIES-54]
MTVFLLPPLRGLRRRPYAALSPPLPATSPPLHGPVAAPSSRAAEPPHHPAAPVAQPHHPAAAAGQPSCRATEPPDSRVAEPPSKRAAEPPSGPAAEPPSRPAAEPPSRRAAEQPSCPAAGPPSRPAAELPLFLLPRPGPTYLDCASPAPPATADSTVRSQWATRDAAARLAVRCHLPTTERAHFSQYRSAQNLYDAVVARYSGASPAPPATADSTVRSQWATRDAAARLAVHRHLPTTELAYLITHLRTSDIRYRAALPAEFCAKNPPPMYLTLYYIVTRLPDSLRLVRDHFLSVCPTTLTVDLLEERLLAAEQSIFAVGASRGDPRTPVFEGCSPSPLLPSVAFAAAADLGGFEALVGLAGAVEVVVEAVEGVGVGVVVGVVAEVEVSAAAVEAAEAPAVAEGAEAAEVAEAAEAAEELVAALRRGVAPVVVSASSSRETPSPQQHREWYAGRQRGGGAGPRTYVLRTGDHAGEQCGGPHSTQRCFGRLTDAWRHQFPDATEIPRRGDLSRAGVDIFDLDYDAILAAIYALSTSDEGDCYLCVPPDLGIEAAALGAGEAAALGSSASAALGADRTTLTSLSRPVAVSLADPSRGPVLARFSTVLPCPAAPSGTLSSLYLPSFSTNLVSGADLQDQGVDQFTPASQQVTHCTCARTGRHLATFTRRPGSSLYTLSTQSPPVSASGQVAASSQVFSAASGSGPESAPCSCRLLSHQTLLWHHRLGHPSLPHLRGMASRVLVSGLPRSLPPLPLGPAPTCVPCVEGRQRSAPHSSEFPPTEAPLQTLHMDVWGPARVRGQGHECYFLLVVDDYSRCTTVFPLRSKGDVTEVGDASAFRVWGSRAFVRDLSADKLSPRAVPCVFLGFPPDAPGWQFYHPTSRRVLSSQDVTFDESAPYYRLFPYRTAPLPPPPLFLAPAVDSGAARGAEPAGAGSGGAESRGAEPGGAEPGGAGFGGAEPKGAEPGGAECGGAEPGGAEPWGAEPGGSELGGAESARNRAAGAGGPTVATGPGGARTGGAGAAGTGGAAAAAGVGAAGVSGAVVLVLQGVLALVFLLTLVRLRVLELALLEVEVLLALLASPLPAPSPYTGPTGGLAERRAPASRPASPVRTARTSRRAPRPRPPAVPGTHQMALRPSTAPLRVLLPSPSESSLPVLADSESDSLRAASPTVARLLSAVVTDPLLESTSASALVAELVDFAARCRLHYAASLVAESETVCPPCVGGDCALSTDVLEDRQEEFQCFAAALPHLVSTLIAPKGDPDASDVKKQE